MLIAAGLGYSIFSSGDDPYAINPVKADNDVSVPGTEIIGRIQKSFTEPHEIVKPDLDGRKVDLFTGVALFSKKDDPGNPVDLLKSDPVHPGIENLWWLKYNLDPGFSDSPDQDPDKDGFTNREEHAAGTDPTEFKEHPDPISKLKLVGVRTTQVHIKPQDFGGGKFMFKLESKGEVPLNRMNQANPQPIGPGQMIPFDRPLMKDRFKLLDVEEREIERSGIKQKVKVWIFEDQKPNKKGTKYEFDSRGNLFGLRNRSRGIMDSTAELLLDALGQAGNPFKVEENTRFSLPFDPNAKEKPYLLKKVDIDNKTIDIEYTDKDGKTQIKQLRYK